MLISISHSISYVLSDWMLQQVSIEIREQLIYYYPDKHLCNVRLCVINTMHAHINEQLI